MDKIKHLSGLEILDSRGNPTLQATVRLESGALGTACVPSGASTGAREALELRDGDKARFGGKGVLKALANIEGPIAAALAGADGREQAAIDARLIELDGSDDKSARSAPTRCSRSRSPPPTPARARPACRCTATWRPARAAWSCRPADERHQRRRARQQQPRHPGMHDRAERLRALFLARRCAPGRDLPCAARAARQQGLPTSVGDEGGFAPNLAGTRQALELILEAIEKAGYKPGSEIGLALDCAASEFHRDGHYHLAGEGEVLSPADFSSYLATLVGDYPIVSIEDGMAEDDWAGWGILTDRLGRRTQLVGDDLFVTNTAIFAAGIDKGIANAILIKPNQIGTLTETLAAMAMASKAGYASIVSHRSGETGDTTIADLAVATGCGQIKTGSASRADRVEKYNRLLAIERELGSAARFAGTASFATR